MPRNDIPICEVLDLTIATLPDNLGRLSLLGPTGEYCAFGWLMHCAGLTDEELRTYQVKGSPSTYGPGSVVLGETYIGLSGYITIYNDHTDVDAYEERKRRATKSLTALKDVICNGAPRDVIRNLEYIASREESK